MNSINKMKVEELREECKKYGIDTMKKSEKTNKLINKIKSEMISDISNYLSS